MFSMTISQAMEEVKRLDSQGHEILAFGLELDQAMKELESLSGMENPVEALRHQRIDMKDEYLGLHQMMQSMNEAILNYIGCEKRVCNNIEQNVILYPNGKGAY